MEITQEVIQEKKSQLTVFDRTKSIMRSETSIERFADALGSELAAKSYIASVLMVVSQSDYLMNCSPESIMISAMRSAVLKLSVDPGIGQAYLVPFKGKCTLIIGYRGYKEMALRTGRYRHLNVATIWKGQEVEEDQLTGVHTIHGKMTTVDPIGYMLFFQLLEGFSKTFYMSIDQITKHAERYSQSWGRKDSAWTTNFEDMCKKTVMRLGLSKWGVFNTQDAMMMGLGNSADPDGLELLEGGGETVTAEWMEKAVEEEIKHKEELKENPKPTEMLISELGFDDPQPSKTVEQKRQEEAIDWASKFTSRTYKKEYGLMGMEELEAELQKITDYKPTGESDQTLKNDRMQALKILIKYLRDQER